MKLTVKWINPKETGKTIALGSSSKAANGLISLGGQFGFVSCGSVELKKQFTVGQEVELPDTAKVAVQTMKQVDGSTKELPVWSW